MIIICTQNIHKLRDIRSSMRDSESIYTLNTPPLFFRLTRLTRTNRKVFLVFPSKEFTDLLNYLGRWLCRMEWFCQVCQCIGRGGRWFCLFLFRHVHTIFSNYIVVFCLRAKRYFVNMYYVRKRIEWPVLTIQCQTICVNNIREYFEHVDDEKLHLLITEAITSIKRVEEKGLKEMLKNTCLNMYFNEICYKFISGNGLKRIVVNYEKENPVSEFVGFPALD